MLNNTLAAELSKIAKERAEAALQAAKDLSLLMSSDLTNDQQLELAVKYNIKLEAQINTSATPSVLAENQVFETKSVFFASSETTKSDSPLIDKFKALLNEPFPERDEVRIRVLSALQSGRYSNGKLSSLEWLENFMGDIKSQVPTSSYTTLLKEIREEKYKLCWEAVKVNSEDLVDPKETIFYLFEHCKSKQDDPGKVYVDAINAINVSAIQKTFPENDSPQKQKEFLHQFEALIDQLRDQAFEKYNEEKAIFEENKKNENDFFRKSPPFTCGDRHVSELMNDLRNYIKYNVTIAEAKNETTRKFV